MLVKFASFDILESSIYKMGDITKSSHLADFDHIERKEGFLYVRSRAISSRTNDNYDMFPAEEIKVAYKTFEGKPVFVNHHNSDHKRMRGVIVAAALHEDKNPDGTDDTWVEVLMEVDAIKFPMLAKAILNGEINRTSMGTDVVASTCTYCGNRAETPIQYCGHIRAQKGQKLPVKRADGKTEMILVAERCEGLSFFENSLLVEEPADPTAFVLGVENGKLGKVAGQLEDAGRYVREADPDTVERLEEDGDPTDDRSLGVFLRENDPDTFKRITSMKKKAFGETSAPQQVDTLADERCPICGSDYDGERCYVCQYIRPPEEFLDPDLNQAKEVDLRQEDEDISNAVSLADEVGHGSEVVDEAGEGHTTDVPEMTEAETGIPGDGILSDGETEAEELGIANDDLDGLQENPMGTEVPVEPTLENQPPEGEGVDINELNDVQLEQGDPTQPEEIGPDGEPIEEGPLDEEGLPAEEGEEGENPFAEDGAVEEAPEEDVGEPMAEDELFSEDEDLEESPVEAPADDQPPAEGTPEAEEPVEPFDAPAETEDENPEVPAEAVDEGDPVVSEDAIPSENDGEAGVDDNDNKNSSDEVPFEDAGDSDGDTVETATTPTESVDIQFDEGEQEVIEDDFETLFAGDALSEEEPAEEEPAEDESENDDEDDDFPPKESVNMTKPNQATRKVANRQPALQAPRPKPTSPVNPLARQASVIRSQASRIAALETALATIARAAGLSRHPAFASILKRAEDIENPAQPEGFALPGDGGEDAPVVTSEEALGFSNESEVSLPDDVEAIGDTTEAEVAPDATTSLEARRRRAARARAIQRKRAETVLDEPLDLDEEDVTEQVAGTDDLAEGAPGEAGSGRTEIDPVIDEVALNNPETMFPVADGGWTDIEAAAKRGEARTYAALRLARLRIQSGIARGDELVLANEIVTSKMPHTAIQQEVNVLSQVVKANNKPQARGGVTPRMSQRRSNPSFQEPAPISVTASTDDEWLFE